MENTWIHSNLWQGRSVLPNISTISFPLAYYHVWVSVRSRYESCPPTLGIINIFQIIDNSPSLMCSCALKRFSVWREKCILIWGIPRFYRGAKLYPYNGGGTTASIIKCQLYLFLFSFPNLKRDIWKATQPNKQQDSPVYNPMFVTSNKCVWATWITRASGKEANLVTLNLWKEIQTFTQSSLLRFSALYQLKMCPYIQPTPTWVKSLSLNLAFCN